MAEPFISLAAFVRSAAQAPSIAAVAAVSIEPDSRADSHTETSVKSETPTFAHTDVVSELALLRLAAIEAFERSVPRLLELLAREVLGRELLLAAPDIDALVARALASFDEHEPVTLALAPCDIQRVRAPLPVRSDAKLGTGDLVVDVRDGAFESFFTLRLERALERAQAAA